MIDRIKVIIEKANKENSNIPPTLIYNEGWMLRLILDWLDHNRKFKHKLSFENENVNWFSEALLPSPFLARFRGDKLAESWTHADGVVGKFKIGENQFGDLSLEKECDFFFVIEAKMFSKLSRGTTHAPNYNQAARNVGCIAELLIRRGLDFRNFKKLAFFVLLPKEQLDIEPTFREYLDKQTIKSCLQKRINNYPPNDNNKDFSWFNKNLDDFINIIDIDLIAWEDILDKINYKNLNEFYKMCLLFNKKK